jgi:hypothetical protein
MAYELHPDMADLETPCRTTKALLVKLAVYAVNLGTDGAGVWHPSSGVYRYIHTVYIPYLRDMDIISTLDTFGTEPASRPSNMSS